MRTAGQDAAQAKAVLDRAIARHGGRELWRKLEFVTLSVRGLGGLVPRLRGLGRSFPVMSVMQIFPHRERTLFFDYPNPGRQGVYDHGRVRIFASEVQKFEFEDGDERRSPRGEDGRWDPLDVLYFFGYSMVNYLSLPFILEDLELITVRLKPSPAAWDQLWFRFPPEAHTHGEIQGFHFDKTGLLLRHDYHAEFVNPGANGAHYTSGYETVEGLAIANHRIVYARILHFPVSFRTPIKALITHLEPTAVSLAP